MQPRDLVILRATASKNSCWPKFCCCCVVLVILVPPILTSPRQSVDVATLREAHATAAVAGRTAADATASRSVGSAKFTTLDTGPVDTMAAAAKHVAQARVSVESQSPALASAVPPAIAVAPAALVTQPLPNCSVVLFHHLEKTAGTTLRSVFQRHAQLGLFDFFSFVNRYNKAQLQMVTHRLDVLREAGQLGGLRLAVEIHIGGGNYEQFLKYTLPDLLLLRSKLRAAGCRCNLVTLLRHPLLAHVSWHHHFVNHRVPLCFWANPYDCQARMSMALACHGGPHIRPLNEDHRRAVASMWDAFDLVGVTEYFDEFLVRLHTRRPARHPRPRPQSAPPAPARAQS